MAAGACLPYPRRLSDCAASRPRPSWPRRPWEYDLGARPTLARRWWHARASGGKEGQRAESGAWPFGRTSGVHGGARGVVASLRQRRPLLQHAQLLVQCLNL